MSFRSFVLGCFALLGLLTCAYLLACSSSDYEIGSPTPQATVWQGDVTIAGCDGVELYTGGYLIAVNTNGQAVTFDGIPGLLRFDQVELTSEKFEFSQPSLTYTRTSAGYWDLKEGRADVWVTENYLFEKSLNVHYCTRFYFVNLRPFKVEIDEQTTPVQQELGVLQMHLETIQEGIWAKARRHRRDDR